MAIAVGWFVAAPAGRTNYLAGVLVSVGTTLLLVGIVVLLERRIVDNAVRKFRNAAEEARVRMQDDFRIEVQDFTDRVSAEWAAASPEDVDAMKEQTKRLSKELADNFSRELADNYVSTRRSRPTTWTRRRSGEGARARSVARAASASSMPSSRCGGSLQSLGSRARSRHRKEGSTCQGCGADPGPSPLASLSRPLDR